MLKSSLIATCVWFLAASASAQIEQGTLRLWIDTDVFVVQQTTIDSDGADSLETELSFGPGGSSLGGAQPGYVGLGIGYVAHPHLLPGVHFSFGSRNVTTEASTAEETYSSTNAPSRTAFTLRPELEFPLNSTGDFVLAPLVGFDFRWSRETNDVGAADDRYEVTTQALGPAVGLVLHTFVVAYASVDLSAIGTIDFLDVEKAGAAAVDPKVYRRLALNVLIGVSAWP